MKHRERVKPYPSWDIKNQEVKVCVFRNGRIEFYLIFSTCTEGAGWQVGMGKEPECLLPS
jgi:hypothetical protein